MTAVTIVTPVNQSLTPEVPLHVDQLEVSTDETYTPTAIDGMSIHVLTCYDNDSGAIVKVTHSSGVLTFDNGGSLSDADCILTYIYLSD